MAELLPEVERTPIELSFVKGSVFVRNFSANDLRLIEKGFPHYTAAAGPSKAGRIQDDKQEEYGDELIAQAVVDEQGKRLWPDRTAVAALGIRRHNEVDRKVGAVLNGTEADGELQTLRGFWRLAADYLRDDQCKEAVAGDFYDAAKRYVEDARKNALASPSERSSPAS